MNQHEKYILAIDLGTSGPKVALVSVNGEVIDGEVGETRLILLPPHGAEQDPADWWQKIIEAAQRLNGRSAIPSDHIVGVCCTSQWSGTVAVDRAGQPLMNAIIWMDARGAPHVAKVTDGPIKLEGYGADKIWQWIRLTGGLPTRSGKDSIAHILYLKNERPDIYRQTYQFLEPKDYLNLQLTGQYAASYESITLHWLTDNRNINKIEYHPRLLQLAGIEREKLPQLRRAVDVLGPLLPEAAAALGVQPGIPVVMGTPDIHSAAIGSGAVRDYEAHLYVGTSSWLTCHIPFKKTDLFHNLASLPSAVPGRYFIANEQETAGACLAYLRDNILYHQDELRREDIRPDIYQVFDRMVAETAVCSNGVLFMPWLNGERTPVENHTVRGGFYNLGLQHNRQHMIRAVYEGVAFNTRWLLGYVEQFIKRPFPAINIVGGGAKSDVWCQIYADVLNRPIRQVQHPIQVNTRGAGLLAAVGLGFNSFDNISNTIAIRHTYQPNPTHRALYDEQFRTFLELYKNNQKTYNRLNR